MVFREFLSKLKHMQNKCNKISFEILALLTIYMKLRVVSTQKQFAKPFLISWQKKYIQFPNTQRKALHAVTGGDEGLLMIFPHSLHRKSRKSFFAVHVRLYSRISNMISFV